jgi:hypothetical protein
MHSAARSDDLSKSSNAAEQVVNKIKRQVAETGGPTSVAQLKARKRRCGLRLTASIIHANILVPACR